MVKESLLRDLRTTMNLGSSRAKVEDISNFLEFIKYIASENEDLIDELEDMDISIQLVLRDVNKKFWLMVKEGVLDCNEGAIENPSFTMSSTLETVAGILLGENDATSAYIADDITVDGNRQDGMVFQEIIELSLEYFVSLEENVIQHKKINGYF